MPHTQGKLEWIEGSLTRKVPGTEEIWLDTGIYRNWMDHDEIVPLDLKVAQAEEMYAMLKEIEWAKVYCRDDSIDVCPSCNNLECYGHEKNCRLAAVLKAVEGEA